MNKQSWRPVKQRKWEDFMETGFHEFYFHISKKDSKPAVSVSSILLLASVLAICVTAVLA